MPKNNSDTPATLTDSGKSTNHHSRPLNGYEEKVSRLLQSLLREHLEIYLSLCAALFKPENTRKNNKPGSALEVKQPADCVDVFINYHTKLKKSRKAFGDVFLAQTTEASSGIPPKIVSSQDESLFLPAKSDPAHIKGLKEAKRLTRKLHHGSYKLLKIVGLQKEAPAWKHTIPLKQIVLISNARLLPKLSNELKKDILYAKKLSSLISNYVLSADNETAKGSGATGLTQVQNNFATEIIAFKKSIEDSIADIADKSNSLSKDLMSFIHHDSKLAGTIEKPARLYTTDKRKKIVADLQLVFLEKTKRFSETERLLCNNLRIDTYLFELVKNGRKEEKRIQDEFSTLFQELIKLLESQIIKEYEKIRTKLQVPAEAMRSDNKVIEHIKQIRAELKIIFSAEFLNQLEKILKSRNAADDLGGFILLRAGDLPPYIDYLITENSNEELPTDANEAEQTKNKTLTADRISKGRTGDINLREEVIAYLRGTLLKNTEKISGTIDSETSTLETAWLQLSEIADINLNSAIDIVETKEEEKPRIQAAELLNETIKRIDERLSKLKEAAEAGRDKILANLSDSASPAFDYLLNVAQNDSYSELKWKSRRFEAERKALDWRAKLSVRWYKLQDQANLFQRFGTKKFTETSTKIRTTLGYLDDGEMGIIETDVAHFLSETDRIIGKLPLIYRRLYRNEPVENPRFLAGRTNDIAIFKKAYTDFITRHYSTLLLAGERGSGKTSLIYHGLQALNLKEKTTVYRIDLKHTIFKQEQLSEILNNALEMPYGTSLDELSANLLKRTDQPIIVFEGFQNLYLRTLHGFGALEAFLLLVSQTGSSVFWVVSSSRYAWTYLDKVFSVKEYFTKFIPTDALSTEDIRDVIMSRHPVSGYYLNFIPEPNQVNSRTYKKLMDDEAAQQQWLAESYFKALSEVAEGNASIALIYWLRSVEMTDENTISIQPVSKSLKQIGGVLKEDDLFALAFVLLHDDLTTEQLAQTLHCTLSESKLLLSRLHAKSLLTTTPDGKYFLNQMLFRNVTRLLKSKNILH
ncbi:MAG: hypothetical protein LAT67_08090 [Balneolales bacterium]|nr:hypothetical protein [Balneolales bacterium]